MGRRRRRSRGRPRMWRMYRRGQSKVFQDVSAGHTHTFIHIQRQTERQTDRRAHAHTHTYTHAHIHTHTCLHTHMHTHAHTQTHPDSF
jgi:hypothetical protein